MGDRRWYWYVGRTLGILWVPPATVLVWVFYIFPMWMIARDLIWVCWAEYGVAEFILSGAHARAWRKWGGWGGPSVFVWRGRMQPSSSPTRRHELEHCRQQFRLGLFFYPAYLVAGLAVWMRGGHWYRDNWFERRARRAAGQPV